MLQNVEFETKLKEFIKRFPLLTKVVNCEFLANGSHGCWIDEHWKGPVSFVQCRFTMNNESGLTLKAEKFPVIQEFEKPIEIKLERHSVGGPRSMNKGNVVVPLNQKKTAPNKLKYINILNHLNPGTVHITECEFLENKYNGLVLCHV